MEQRVVEPYKLLNLIFFAIMSEHQVVQVYYCFDEGH